MRLFFTMTVLFAGFIYTPTNCDASLGDTLKDCKNRYGTSISSGKGDSTNGELAWWAFRHDGFEIEESFSGGAVVIEVIWKKDKSSISQAEQISFLGQNSRGSKWSEPQATYKGTFWKREDGATALYSTIDNQMTFSGGPKKDHGN